MRMRSCPWSMLAMLFCTLSAQAQPAPAAIDSGKKAGLIFSVRTWDGDYFSKEVPGGVITTPVLGAIYSINADGSGLRKIVQLGKNTDFPAVDLDGNWVYFQSNTICNSQF